MSDTFSNPYFQISKRDRVEAMFVTLEESVKTGMQYAAIGFLVGSVFIPGPEDVVLSVLALRHGITATRTGINGLLEFTKNGKKLTAKQSEEATRLLKEIGENYNAPKSGYLNPGIGAAARGQIFNHAWIKHDLFNELQGLVGKSDFNKFVAALKKGVVGPTGESGIKIFANPVGKYTHELKIGGSAQRLLGYIDENGVLMFDKFVRGGLH